MVVLRHSSSSCWLRYDVEVEVDFAQQAVEVSCCSYPFYNWMVRELEGDEDEGLPQFESTEIGASAFGCGGVSSDLSPPPPSVCVVDVDTLAAALEKLGVTTVSALAVLEAVNEEMARKWQKTSTESSDQRRNLALLNRTHSEYLISIILRWLIHAFQLLLTAP
jgi:hypothetical protein